MLKKGIKKVNDEIKYLYLKEVTEKKYLKKLLKESAKRLTELYLKEVENWGDKQATFYYRDGSSSLNLPIRKKDSKNYEVKAGKGKEYYDHSPFYPDKISTIEVNGEEYNVKEVSSYNPRSRLKIKAERDNQTVYFYFVAGGGSKDEKSEIFFCYGYNQAAGVNNAKLNPNPVLYPAEYAEEAENYYKAGQNYYKSHCKKDNTVKDSVCYPMDMKGRSPGTMGKIFKEMIKFFENQGYDIPEKVNPGAFNDRGNLCRADVIVMTTNGHDKKFEPISLKKADAVNKGAEIQDSLELANVEFKYERGDSIRVNLKNSFGIDLSCIQFRNKGDRLSIVYNPVKGGDSQGYALTSLLEIDKSILEDFREKFLKKLQNNPKIRETLKHLEISDIPMYIKKSSNFQKYLNNPKNIPEVSEFQNSLKALKALLMLNIQTSSELVQNISVIGNPLEMWSLVGIYYIEYTYKWKSPIKIDAVLNIDDKEQKFFELTGGFLAFLQDSLDGKIKPVIDSTPVSIDEYLK